MAGPGGRREGKELFYLSRENKLMAVKVQEKDAMLEIGSAQALFRVNPPASQNPGRVYDVTSDGKKFIVVTRLPEPVAAEPITLVVNWPALLKDQRGRGTSQQDCYPLSRNAGASVFKLVCGPALNMRRH